MTLPAFAPSELDLAKRLLAARIAYMMGRKLEEGDWAHVYCKSKNLVVPNWSNFNADLMVPGLALEHKMMRQSESVPIHEHCGTVMMHPALTRQISLPNIKDANEAMRQVIQTYQRVLDARREKVKAISPDGNVEMRSGWLIYESSLTEFLYFEEPTLNLVASEHYGVWSQRELKGEGGRRSNKNLWIFNKKTKQKVWSVTGGGSGTKIQPYFTVPAADDPNLYYFRAQGEPLTEDTVRVWITEPTANLLKKILGDLEPEHVSKAILEASATANQPEKVDADEPVHEVVILNAAYVALKQKFLGVSDEHRFQLLCKQLTVAP